MASMIGRQIAEARRARGLSQSAAARKLKITTMYLSRLECGRQEPSLRVLRAISTLFNVEIVVHPDLELGPALGEAT